MLLKGAEVGGPMSKDAPRVGRETKAILVRRLGTLREGRRPFQHARRTLAGGKRHLYELGEPRKGLATHLTFSDRMRSAASTIGLRHGPGTQSCDGRGLRLSPSLRYVLDRTRVWPEMSLISAQLIAEPLIGRAIWWGAFARSNTRQRRPHREGAAVFSAVCIPVPVCSLFTSQRRSLLRSFLFRCCLPRRRDDTQDRARMAGVGRLARAGH